MGSSKDYIAVSTDIKASNVSNPPASSPPPPPYEEEQPLFPLRWKVVIVCVLLTFACLTMIGFSIHPDREHGHLIKVDLGFPQGTQQHNLAQDALTDFMTRIVREAEQNAHSHRHHGKHHNHDYLHSMNYEHHPHHGKQHHRHHQNHDHSQYPHDRKHHKHRPHHDHSFHSDHTPHIGRHRHHQKREEDDTLYIQKLPTHHHYQPPSKQEHRRQEEDDTVYTQKLPTHNHYQPPTKHANTRREEDDTADTVYIQKLPTHHRYQPPTKHIVQRRELAAALPEGKQQQPWSQSYRLTPSTKTSLHILSSHIHSSSMGRITLRQDTTGIEQDIVVTFRTNPVESVIPVKLSTNNVGNAFFIRARSVSRHGPSNDYSIDIVFPSNINAMKNLNIHTNNGTIHADTSLQVAFESCKFSANYGSMSIQKLTADRIMLGVYSGVINGSLQAKDRLAVGAYYGHSNVRLLQPSFHSSHCRHFHVAASSPHGVSEITLEEGAFDGQFIAYRTLEDAPNVNYTSNDKQHYGYQMLDQRYSGWFMNNSASSQMIIHGRDETSLIFE